MKDTVTYGRSRIERFVYQHPYVSFLVFLAATFCAMAIFGLNDMGDRVAALGGM